MVLKQHVVQTNMLSQGPQRVQAVRMVIIAHQQNIISVLMVLLKIVMHVFQSQLASTAKIKSIKGHAALGSILTQIRLDALLVLKVMRVMEPQLQVLVGPISM